MHIFCRFLWICAVQCRYQQPYAGADDIACNHVAQVVFTGFDPQVTRDRRDDGSHRPYQRL